MTETKRDRFHQLARRASGILLHVTSLPGTHGSGDLGREAHAFVDFLADAGQSWWQMLPVGPPGRAPSFSPYDSASAFAGSPWLVSLDELAREGLLAPDDVLAARDSSARAVEHERVQRFREERLRRACAAFLRSSDHQRDLRAFRDEHADWLEDFALFAALRRESGGKSWTEWELGVRTRDEESLRAARARLADEIDVQCFVQLAFDRQWSALRDAAHARDIRLIGDLPIFVAHDSADVWSHPELFRLDRSGRPTFVSGYPPDRFNALGQLWGHPQYRWSAHEATGFEWWVRRFDRSFELVDALRVDHFLGFTRTWSIPATDPDARRGKWVKSPGFTLFSALESRRGKLPLIAEDLGLVTREANELRDTFGLAPMRIFQFGFDAGEDSAEHRPHHWTRRTAAYTGNHDTDTTKGWFDAADEGMRARVLAYTGARAGDVARAAIRAVSASHADLVVFPMQDVLGLDHRARMNTPGTAEGNWRWRIPPSEFREERRRELARELRALTETFDRLPIPNAVGNRPLGLDATRKRPLGLDAASERPSGHDAEHERANKRTSTIRSRDRARSDRVENPEVRRAALPVPTKEGRT